MILTKIVFIFFLMYSEQSTSALVVKNNGDEVELSNVCLYYGSSESCSAKATFMYNGKLKEWDFSEVKRINLKEVKSRKKGVVTWKALLIRRDNEKFEVEIQLDRIEGDNPSGEKIEISGGAIDKISF
ncbi:MAG: hypothetical protein RIM99_20135 [Cyclobacteriaceae bacterium]